MNDNTQGISDCDMWPRNDADLLEEWMIPTRRLIQALGIGTDTLWSALRVAQDAAYDVADHDPGAWGVDVIAVAWDLTEAVEEIEWIRPELAAYGLVCNPGPLPGRVGTVARDTLLTLLTEIADLAVQVCADGVNPRASAERLKPADVVAVSRVTSALGLAVARLTARASG